MTDKTEPVADELPNMEALHAGADPIDEEEDLGNVWDDEPPKEEAPPVEVTDETEGTAPAETKAPADAPEATGTAEEPAVEDEPEETAKPDIRIPKARLDQETARRRAAEARLAEFEKNSKAPAAAPDPELDLDFGESAKEMFDKVLDGDLGRATQLFNDSVKKAANAAAKAALANIDEKIESGTRRSTAKTAFDSAVQELEDKYEVFRPGSDTFDEALVEEALTLKIGFEARGHSPAEALRQGVNYALRMHHPEYFEEAPPVPEVPEKKGNVTPIRDPKQVAKNVAASKQQPPTMPKATPDDSTVVKENVLTMSEEEWEALPLAKQKQLRGDYL